MATHSIILAWRIPWTEEPGRLHITGSQRIRHDQALKTTKHDCLFTFITFLKILLNTCKHAMVYMVKQSYTLEKLAQEGSSFKRKDIGASLVAQW